MENTKIKSIEVIFLLFKNYNKEGFTLIEVLLASALLVIILAIAYPFLISNMKLANETESKAHMEQEAQIALKYFSKAAFECEKITTLEGREQSETEDTNKINSNQPISLKKIIFSTDTDSEGKTNVYTFSLTDGKLYYSKTGLSNLDMQIAQYIDEITIKTLDNEEFSQCSGIEISLKFSLKGSSYSISTTEHFRNSKN